ncbi:MAG TPA: hypothetical protein VGB13_03975 [Candidatus Krumholzibacteria bacterium]|jgi:hypothetical protein
MRRVTRATWIPLALYFAQQPLYRNYLTDDSYIYAQFARNLARSGELVFQRGEAIHAATSPLWAALGAVGVLLGFDAFVWLKFLGIACGAVAVFWMTQLSLASSRNAFSGLLVAVAFAVEPWFVRWSASGMETALAALLVVAILRFGWCEQGRPRALFGMCLAAGLAPLVRPEAVLLSAMVALRLLMSPRRSEVAAWVALVAPLGLWAAYALPSYGHLWPQTVKAKSTPLGLDPSRLLANLRVLATQLAVAAPVALAGLVAAALRWRKRRRQESWLSAVLWVWIVALPTIYLIRDVSVVSRYLELILPVILFLGGRAILQSRAGRGLWMGQIFLALALSIFWISPSTRAFSRSIDVALGDIAEWLRLNSHEDDIVAVYDIGLVGYRADRRLLDLGGLVHPGINELRNSVDDEEIVRRGLFRDYGDPDYLVHRASEPEALRDTLLRDRRPIPILYREVANLGLRQVGPVFYTLYALRPTDEPRAGTP